MLFKNHKLNQCDELIDKYDIWLIDLYGVMHDGSLVFDEAYSALIKLAKSNKRVFFISNAPRLAENEINKIIKLGIDEELFSGLLTSGSLCSNFLVQNSSNFGKNYYYFGMEHNRSLLSNLSAFNEVENLLDSNFIILSGPLQWGADPSHYSDFFDKAISINLPLVCPNADKRVSLNGNIYLCAGSFANYYENLGGKVYWFGKPHQSIFEESIKILESSKMIAVDKSKIIMVGDSLETDILGANNFGIDSLLCHKTGIHAELNLNEFLSQYNAKPNYIIDAFK